MSIRLAALFQIFAVMSATLIVVFAVTPDPAVRIAGMALAGAVEGRTILAHAWDVLF